MTARGCAAFRFRCRPPRSQYPGSVPDGADGLRAHYPGRPGRNGRAAVGGMNGLADPERLAEVGKRVIESAR